MEEEKNLNTDEGSLEKEIAPEAPIEAEVSQAASEPVAPSVDEHAGEEEIEAAALKQASSEIKPKAEKKWYVVQTFTGQEDRAKQAIEQTIQSQGLQLKVLQVLVPVEETIEIKGGKRVERIRKMFPGYVFLEMVLDEETWYNIRQSSGVARFIGTKVQPTPVSEREMQRVLKQLGKEEKLESNFEKNEVVRIISGPFRGYTGIVDEINTEKGKLKVLINIFGRDTPVEVNFEHAQKIV
ncbi:MAG: transcription termination/antitermination protein NusG [Candidatus Margulisiibacteriota bacterium]